MIIIFTHVGSLSDGSLGLLSSDQNEARGNSVKTYVCRHSNPGAKSNLR